MYRQTIVVLPPLVHADNDVKEWLDENLELWSGAFDEEVDYIDPRADFLGYEIDQIDVTEGRVYVQYTVEYDVYYGCKDMDGAGEDEREFIGQVTNGTIVFQTFVQPDPMAPDEEL